jgi:hypothetical protein
MRLNGALAFDLTDVNLVITRLALQCKKLSDGCDLLIFVISVTGITTDLDGLVLFIKDKY